MSTRNEATLSVAITVGLLWVLGSSQNSSLVMAIRQLENFFFFLSEKVTRRNNIRDEKNDHFVIIDSSVGHRYRCMDLR